MTRPPFFRFFDVLVASVAVAALGLCACSGAPPKPDSSGAGASGASGSSGASGVPGAAGAGEQPRAGASKKPEEQLNPRSVRLFDDAVKAYNDMKQVKVFDWPALENRLQAVIEADDRFAEAYFNLGVVYEKQKKLSEARKAYKRALERKPSLTAAAENLAVMLQNEGRNADALEAYKEILRRHPEDGRARARIAALFLETEDQDSALRFAREALMREPQNLTAYKVMMRSFLAKKNLNMAKLVALRATKIAQDPELYYTMGLIALEEHDEQGAMMQFRQALKERDDYLLARTALADIAVKHRDWVSAAEQYRKIVQHDPKNVTARINLGVALKGLGQVDKAMAEYDTALKLDPKTPQPYFLIGLILQKNKDAPEKAIEYYKKFVEAAGPPADHPVFAQLKECEQLLRQMQEAKEQEERQKLEKQREEARKKAEEGEKKRLEDQKKKEEMDKVKAEDDAKKQAELSRRQKEAKEAVDSALGPPQDQAKRGAPPSEKAPPSAQPKQPTSTTSQPPPRSQPAPPPAAEPKAAGSGQASEEPTDTF